MAQTWFITGTDTEVGKTWCSAALVVKLQQLGYKVAVMKPIASGCEFINGKLYSNDALILQANCNLKLDYDWLNPYAFAPPIAPHLAAAQINSEIELDKIIATHNLLQKQADIIIVEGVGGWRVPINAKQSLVDLVKALQAQVILVVGLRLGCINHALLSCEIIQHDGCKLLAWIANSIDPDYDVSSTVISLRNRIDAPLFGIMPFSQNLDTAYLAQFLSIYQ